MAEERGPSYHDVEVAVEHIRDRFGMGVDFLVVSPLYIRATGARQSWMVCARAWWLKDSREWHQGGRAGFGRGGQWATMPAAMHSACLQLIDKLEAEERKRVEQAAF